MKYQMFYVMAAFNFVLAFLFVALAAGMASSPGGTNDTMISLVWTALGMLSGFAGHSFKAYEQRIAALESRLVEATLEAAPAGEA